MAADDCVPYAAKTLGGVVARRMIPATFTAPLIVRGTLVAMGESLKRVWATADVLVLGPLAQVVFLIQTLKYSGCQVTVLPTSENLSDTQRQVGSGAVAVISMSMRLPKANVLVQFWQHPMGGRTTRGMVSRYCSHTLSHDCHTERSGFRLIALIWTIPMILQALERTA